MWGDVKEVVTTISAIIALMVSVGSPLVWLVRKYNKTLKDFTAMIKEQSSVNAEQWEEIQQIKEDGIERLDDELVEVTRCLEINRLEHSEIGDHLEGLRQGILVLIQIDLDKLLCRCIARGFRTLKDSERADLLYSAYTVLKGNHGMNRKKTDFDNLPLKEEE